MAVGRQRTGDIVATLPREIAKDVETAVAILRRHGARRIVLYGSLARGDYRMDSDIDLCYEGIPSEDYFRTVAECIMQIPRRVCVVDIKDTRGLFRERIMSEGKVLYEARPRSRRG